MFNVWPICLLQLHNFVLYFVSYALDSLIYFKEIKRETFYIYPNIYHLKCYFFLKG